MNVMDKVSNETIIKRLREIVEAITKGGRDAVLRECIMHIPARPESDADLILSAAAQRLEKLSNKE